MSSETRPRFLFVDDEPNVLRGLRRALHAKAGAWEMSFDDNAEHALAALDTYAPDVVVSDIRMPVMDGVTFLRRVRASRPGTVRFALSAQADRATTLRAVSEIHQFLEKPVQPQALVAHLERALQLSTLLGNPQLKRMVDEMEGLPSVAELYDEVVLQLEAPDPTIDRVGHAIAHNSAMSTKVLQLVNSSFFGLAQTISKPEHAAALLGLDTLRTLVLGVRIFNRLEPEPEFAEFHQREWEHAVRTARLSRRLSLAEQPCEHDAECAYLAGLLHGVGRLIYRVQDPRKYEEFVAQGTLSPARAARIERSLFGASSGELGAYMLGIWGFTETVIEAIAYHAEPGRAAPCGFQPLTAVHVAVGLLNGAADESNEWTRFIDEDYLRTIGMHGRLEVWRAMAGETVSHRPGGQAECAS